MGRCSRGRAAGQGSGRSRRRRGCRRTRCGTGCAVSACRRGGGGGTSPRWRGARARARGPWTRRGGRGGGAGWAGRRGARRPRAPRPGPCVAPGRPGGGGAGGRRVTVSCSTVTRWRRRYEEGGFDALVPSPRQPAPRTPEEVLAVAEALKREKPGRTAAQVRRILQVTSGWAPSDRTLQRLFERLELNVPASGPEEEQRAFGRFECARPNEMWIGDPLHGPVIRGRETRLFTSP